VKRLQLAAVATVTLLISGCSRVTTVSERRDYKSPGGKSIEVTENWALPGFLKSFLSFLVRLLDSAFYQHGGENFIVAWVLIGIFVAIGAFIMAILDV
jgi:hypothetical protein